MREHLSTLPAKYRIVLILRHLQDMTYEEMAEILMMPIGTIKTHLFRARNLLKSVLRLLTRVENERLIMRCSKATHMLQLYIDKRLPFEHLRALESDLMSCSVCRKNSDILEEIEVALNRFEMVAEPTDLTMNVMKRVALSTQAQYQKRQTVKLAKTKEEKQIFTFRPSLIEWFTAIALATVTMLVLVIGAQAARHSSSQWLMLPSSFFQSLWSLLAVVNGDTFMTLLWILGTVLGIWITLVVAGADMRNQWFKAVLDRLPVRL